jgi:hypothetical protein
LSRPLTLFFFVEPPPFSACIQQQKRDPTTK